MPAIRILKEHLAEFRNWPYAELASQVAETKRKHNCMYATQGTTPAGDEYFVEINAFWDDRPGGNVRVTGDLSWLSPPKHGDLMGFLPFNRPDVIESFIMAPDGTFVGE